MENKVWVVKSWGIKLLGDYDESIEAIYQTEELAMEHLAYAREFYEHNEGEKVIGTKVNRIYFEDESGYEHGLYYTSVRVLDELGAAEIYDQFRNES